MHVAIDQLLDSITALTINIIKIRINVKDTKSPIISITSSNKTNMVMGHLDMYIGKRQLLLVVVLVDMIIVVLHQLDIVRQDHMMIDPDHLIENHPLNHVDINKIKGRGSLTI